MKFETDFEPDHKELGIGKIRHFEKLFRIYYPRLKRYANCFIENSEKADDLVQDAFIKIWKYQKSFKNEKHFASFIFTMVKNSCLNELKRKTVEDKYVLAQLNSETEELYHISFEVNNEFVSMENRLTEELQKIISLMPDRCKTAFRLKWIEGKKNREIAKEMKISTTMVDKHLLKGLQIAKNNISKDLFLFLFITRK